MTATLISPQSMKPMPKPNIFLSEIFPLSLSNSNLSCFRLNPEVTKKIGNRFSWRFSQNFPNVVVIWQNGYFWILAKSGQKLPEISQWKEAIVSIQETLRDDIGNLNYSYQEVRQFQITPIVQAEFASRLLKNTLSLSLPSVLSKNKVEVKRMVKFWAEILETEQQKIPALTLTVESNIFYQGDLEIFYNNHPYRQDPQKLLIGLRVKEIEKGTSGKIIALARTIGERREELKEWATGAISQQKLIEAPDDQPVVSVQFGKNPKRYDYPMAALLPYVTEDTAERFEVQYGELLSYTKISYSEREKLLKKCRDKAQEKLVEYGLSMKRNVNSAEYKDLFFVPKIKLEDTPILFGKGFIGKKSAVLSGLSKNKGGVYRRHNNFSDINRPIRIGLLNVCDRKVGKFCVQLEQQLEKYGFKCLPPKENKKNISIKGLSGTDARAKIEEALDELVVVPVDIVLVFLPQSDRNADSTEGGSLYTWIYSRLLRRQIASQVIYEQTISDPNKYRYILNQVAPGILAKLGNLPFILADPLEIADYFIGLDISRRANKRLAGSQNACASVRLYGQQGDFLRYRIEDAIIEGEEIPQRTLESFLPKAELKNKTVLIYRDGPFRGEEINHLLARANAINAKFILVECCKSYVPRLYNFAPSQSDPSTRELMSPSRGLALRLSSREVILVTTKLASENIGVPRPLRLKICEQGEQVSLESLVETTLKLTLLHHGALKEPRLPIPLFGSDRIAKLRLQGIYPGSPEGDRQFWL